MPEAEQNKVLTRASLRLAVDEPGRFLAGLLRRFFLPWKIMPGEVSSAQNIGLLRLAALLTDGWILPLGLLGAWFERKNEMIAPAVLLALTLTLTYALTRAPIRYRVPLMPVFIVFAGLGARRLAGEKWGLI